MKWYIVRRTIFSLTVVALVLAGFTIATVDSNNSSGAQQENPIGDQRAQDGRPTIVNNSVETVETMKEATFIASEAEPFIEPAISAPEYTEEELEILALIIYQEAGGDACSDDTRRKVGSVFLNRVNSPLFPDTFKEVATAERQYGRLHWTGIVWPDRAKNEGEAHAVDRAYRIAEELLVSGSVLPDNVIWQAEFEQGDGVYCYQDVFYFCYSEVNK